MIYDCTHQPGDIAIWRRGAAILSWPPDGHREYYEPIKGLNPKKDTMVFIVCQFGYHGYIVLVEGGLWWCPKDSLVKKS